MGGRPLFSRRCGEGLGDVVSGRGLLLLPAPVASHGTLVLLRGRRGQGRAASSDVAKQADDKDEQDERAPALHSTSFCGK